jgi:hypothetical protein
MNANQRRAIRVFRRKSPFKVLANPKRRAAARRAPNGRQPLVVRTDAPVATTTTIRGNSGPPSRPYSLVRREYISDVVGSVAFANTQFAVNPAISATFPWGGGIASNYEEYECNSISFIYEPESSSSSTGAVILAFDYDALDAAPTTKQQALEMADSIRSAPWVPCRLDLKTVDLRKRGTLYTRTATVANSDLKTYDLGNINVATVGQSGATTIGEFWIEYHFTLRVPQLTTSSATRAEGKVVGVTVSPASFFGTTPTVTGAAVTATSNTVTFAVAGSYAVSISMTGLTTGSGINTITTGSTATVSLQEAITGPNVSATGQCQWNCLVTATAGQTLVLAFTGAGIATLTGSVLRAAPFTLS